MSHGNRGYVAAAIFGLITCSFGIGSWATASYGDQRQARYPRYEEAQSDRPVALPGRNGPSQYRRPCEKPEGKDESELCAQWNGARAAERAADWAFIQMILSGFGVFGLILTLAYNRDALRIARQANDANREALFTDNRAWVDVCAELDPNRPFEWEGDHCRVGLIIRAENCGNSAAKALSLNAEITYHPDVRARVVELISANRKPSGLFRTFLFPGNNFGPMPIDVLNKRENNWLEHRSYVTPKIIAFATYRTIFDKPTDPLRISVRIYDLYKSPHNGISINDCPVPAEDLILVINAIDPGDLT